MMMHKTSRSRPRLSNQKLLADWAANSEDCRIHQDAVSVKWSIMSMSARINLWSARYTFSASFKCPQQALNAHHSSFFGFKVKFYSGSCTFIRLDSLGGFCPFFWWPDRERSSIQARVEGDWVHSQRGQVDQHKRAAFVEARHAHQPHALPLAPCASGPQTLSGRLWEGYPVLWKCGSHSSRARSPSLLCFVVDAENQLKVLHSLSDILLNQIVARRFT